MQYAIIFLRTLHVVHTCNTSFELKRINTSSGKWGVIQLLKQKQIELNEKQINTKTKIEEKNGMFNSFSVNLLRNLKLENKNRSSVIELWSACLQIKHICLGKYIHMNKHEQNNMRLVVEWTCLLLTCKCSILKNE